MAGAEHDGTITGPPQICARNLLVVVLPAKHPAGLQTVQDLAKPHIKVAGPLYIRGAKLGFASIAPEVEEAAAMDGASTLQRFWHVTLPLALPGLASGIVQCLVSLSQMV